jgi:hypothetical protein
MLLALSMAQFRAEKYTHSLQVVGVTPLKDVFKFWSEALKLEQLLAFFVVNIKITPLF